MNQYNNLSPLDDYEHYYEDANPAQANAGGAGTSYLENHFTAIIVDADDPDKKNRFKIRVAGVHPGPMQLPDEDLPWVFTKQEMGGNAGIGKKAALEKGQKVEVQPLDIANTDWVIVSGSIVHAIDEGEQQGSMGAGDMDSMETGISKILPEGFGGAGGASNPDTGDRKAWSPINNPRLSPEFIPKLASTIMDKLEQTVYDTINNNLMSIVSGRFPMMDPDMPGGGFGMPANGWPIIAGTIDLTRQLVHVSSRNFDLKRYVKIRKMSVVTKINSRDYNITITGQGKVVGADSNGNPVSPTVKNWVLSIPGSVEFDQKRGYTDYSFGYTVQHKKFPSNKKSGKINIRIGSRQPNQSAPPPPVSPPPPAPTSYGCSMPALPGLPMPGLPGIPGIPIGDLPGMMGAITPGIMIDEIAKTSELGNVWQKIVNQLPNGLSFEYDGSDDNVNFSISHPAGARIEVSHEGHLIFKASTNDDMLDMDMNPAPTEQTKDSQLDFEPFDDPGPAAAPPPGMKVMKMNPPKVQILSDEGDVEIAGDNLKIVMDTTINAKAPMTYFSGDGFVVEMTGVHIKAEKVLIEAPDVEITGNLWVGGDIVADGDVMARAMGGMGVSLEKHKHPSDGVPPTPTDPIPMPPKPPEMDMKP